MIPINLCRQKMLSILKFSKLSNIKLNYIQIFYEFFSIYILIRMIGMTTFCDVALFISINESRKFMKSGIYFFLILYRLFWSNHLIAVNSRCLQRAID